MSEDTLIVFDNQVTIYFLKWLQKNNADKRIILWYWNSIESIDGSLNPSNIPRGIEKWTYVPSDSKKYEMKLNSTFYSRIYLTVKKEPIKQDILFIGKDKGRRERLLLLQNLLQNQKLNINFYITKSYRYDIDWYKRYQKRLSYCEITEMISQSRAILDLPADNTDGITIRPMEALFNEKKLITSNKAIKYLDFYDEQNIFILGEDEIENLNSFVMKDTVPIDMPIINYYEFYAWVKRFLE